MALEVLEIRAGAGCPVSEPDGDSAEELEVAVALSVEYVEVIGPADRDGLCSIYGKICFWDAIEGFPAPVTLFNRSRDEAETIDLDDPDFRFLTLTDDGSSRPLFGGNPVFVKMKLFEKLDDNEEDSVIAQLEYKHYGYCKTGRRCFFQFESNSRFCINIAYANIFFGVSVRFEFTINKGIAGDEEEQKEESTTTGNKRKQPMSIYGTIGATQSLNGGDMPAIRLYYATSHEPRQVDIGSPIDLDRKLVVAPTSGGVLGIGYTLYDASNDKLITQNAIPFCLRKDDIGVRIKVPKDMTYTKTANDGLVTASITFVPYTYPQVEHGK